jgi:hypothetical protein
MVTKGVYMLKGIALIILVLITVSCTLRMTYNSEPQGALITQNGRTLGRCPFYVDYRITWEDRKNGKMQLPDCYVVWASGAAKLETNVEANLKKYGRYQTMKFFRPISHPGYETDVLIGIAAERNEIARQTNDSLNQMLWNQQEMLYLERRNNYRR